MMEIKKTKKSPKEIIESEKKPKYESIYVKFPGQEMEQVTLKSTRKDGLIDTEKVDNLYKKNKKRFTLAHTHPSKLIYNYLIPIMLPGYLTPSQGDLKTFLLNESIKNMLIAQRNPKTGKVEGYLYVRKPKEYRALDKDEIEKKNWKIGTHFMGLVIGPRNISDIMKEYGLKYKFMPARGYESINSFFGTRFKKKKDLETKIIPIIGFSLLASLFFLSSNLTGFAIADLTQKTSNTIGIISFVVGLIGTFYYFRKKGAK